MHGSAIDWVMWGGVWWQKQGQGERVILPDKSEPLLALSASDCCRINILVRLLSPILYHSLLEQISFCQSVIYLSLG